MKGNTYRDGWAPYFPSSRPPVAGIAGAVGGSPQRRPLRRGAGAGTAVHEHRAEIPRCHEALTGATRSGPANLAAADRFIDLFREQSARHGLRIWHTIARCFEGVLCTKRGDLAAGLVIVRTALGELPESRFALPYMAIAGDLAEALGKAGDIAAGMATIERAERDGERWCLAELARIKGELTLLAGSSNTAAAEDYFWSALRWARQQQVLSWEMRAAMSMARLWAGQNNRTGARDLLAPIQARFTEGFDTGDLMAAAALLEQLAHRR